MSTQTSKKHHFIPQFYLKGFADENNDLFIYDIEFKKIGNSPKKSSQIFYEEHLHTVKKFGKQSLLIEESYSELEGMFALIVDKIESLPNEALQEVLKANELLKILILMLSVQYWRNPKNAQAAKEMSRKLTELYDLALPTNFEVMPFEKKDLKRLQKNGDDAAIQKFIQFLVLPLITFKFSPEQTKGLKIIRLEDKDEFICSDSPVMIDNFDSEFNFDGNVLYPLTKKFAITNIQFKNSSELDNIVLSHARMKVVASSKERLSALPQAA